MVRLNAQDQLYGNPKFGGNSGTKNKHEILGSWDTIDDGIGDRDRSEVRDRDLVGQGLAGVCGLRCIESPIHCGYKPGTESGLMIEQA